MMKNFKRLFTFLLLGTLIFSLFAPACGASNTGDTSASSSSSASSGLTVDFENYPFYEDRVKIAIKPEYSDINKVWTTEDFSIKGNTIVEIIGKTWYAPNSPNFQQGFTLILKEHGRDKVIDAITQLMEFNFIKWVEPEYQGFWLDTAFGSCDIL